MDKLYIVIPAYNEEENIEKVIEEWYRIADMYNGDGESRLLVIDDGSRDHTFEIMDRMREGRPLLLPVTKKNSGHGPTLLYGYRYAVTHGADYIFQTDSDGQTRPEEFHAFWEQRKRYDMVTGYRSRRQDGISRIFVTKTLKLVIRLCFGVSVTDANTPFRLMKSSVLERQLKDIPDSYNLPNVILSVLYAKRGLKVHYVPITFRPRQGGVNSINLKKITGIGVRAVGDFREINRALEKKEKAAPSLAEEKIRDCL